MTFGIDEATESFLVTAQGDLQRHLGRAGELRSLTLEQMPSGVTLVARVQVGQRMVAFFGAGEDLVSAYAALTNSRGEPGAR